jgi:hypothetical protein
VVSFYLNPLQAQQFLVNQAWTTATGQPDTTNFTLTAWDKFAWSASELDNYGKLVTTGNTFVSPGNTDVLLTKYNTNGQILWQKTFDGPAGGYDYGISVEIDVWNNIYVAGTTMDSNGFMDYFIIKTNSSGTQQWTYTWDGNSGLHDVPSAIYLDNSGNSFIVGASYDSQNATDVVLIKLNSTGSLVWQSAYDYAGLDEVPLSIKKWNMVGSMLEVSALSASTPGQWAVAKIRFSSVSGGIQYSYRVSVPQLSLQDVYTFTADDSGNVYLASAVDGGSSGKDMEIVKVTEAGVQWVQTIDRGGDDYPKSMALDTAGNLLVTGSVEVSGGAEILTLKMDTVGTEVWSRNYRAPVYQKNARPVKLKTDDQGNIFVTGASDTEDGVQDYTTFMYDANGLLRFDQKLDANNGSTDTPTDMVLSPSGKEVFVTGESVGSGGMEYVTVKYEVRERNNEVVYESGKPHHKAHELIVKFRPQFVNTTFVDDRTKRFGDISEILPDSVIKILNEALRYQLSKAKVSKIYHHLTTAHQKSITRLGDTIDIPEFWSSFLFEFPAAENIDTLMNRFNQVGEYVEYAEYNYLCELTHIPNDNLFENGWQQSLFAAPGDPWPDANINVEPAWNLETGQNYVRVGVLDYQLLWSHPDFGGPDFENSQIVDGWDLYNNVPIESITNPAHNHGTQIAGVIGALRDNAIGIAGIAGGGIDGENNVNPGVELYSLGSFEWEDYNGDGILNGIEGRFAGLDVVAPAIGLGAMFSPDAEPPVGFGLHIQNISWGTSSLSSILRDNIYFAFSNQCVIVAGRGNANRSFSTGDLLDDPTGSFYPASFRDDWVISVGASGRDGEYHGNLNGDLIPENTGTGIDEESWWNSYYGDDMDFVAPGVSDVVSSLLNQNAASPINWIWGGVDICGILDIDYSCFNGTSASAPHVSGVAALMLSLHNVNKEGKEQWNNLAPEDVEQLLERYATDINGPDYDLFNGWGRINAWETVQRLEAPEWRVFHNGEPQTINQTTTPGILTIGDTGLELPIGIYGGEWVEVEHLYTDVFSPSTQIIEGWNRLSSTIGTVQAQNGFYFKYPWSDFDININGNIANVSLTTYCFHATSDENTGQSGLDVWLPASPEDIQTAYSLHLFDPLATSIENIEGLGVVSISPNPNEGIFNLDYNLLEAEVSSVQLVDISGKLIFEKLISPSKTGEVSFDLSGVSSGIYVCRLTTDKGVISKKVIKQ